MTAGNGHHDVTVVVCPACGHQFRRTTRTLIKTTCEACGVGLEVYTARPGRRAPPGR